MDKTTERLYQALRELKNLDNPSDIARALDTTPQRLKNWESRGISQQGLNEIQAAFGVSSTWLASGEGDMTISGVKKEITSNAKDLHPFRTWSENDPLPPEGYVSLPFLKESEFAGGVGSFENQDRNGFRLPFAKSTLWRKGINPDKAFCATLTGDSMAPLIPDGSTIGIDTGIEGIRDGQIYAFVQDGLFRVKYLYRLPDNRVRIRSENEARHSEETAAGESLHIIGRVFWWSVML